MAQSQIVILSDNGVSRMLADKAVRNQVFRKQLLGYDTNKNLRVIIQAITTTRQKIADQAGLKAPSWVNGKPRDLNEYLNRSQISRGLCSKVLKEEGSEVTSVEDHHKWGWVGSPKCIASLAVAFLQSTLRFQADPSPFPFQLLPPELRLQICQEALSGAVYDGIIRSRSITVTQTRNKPQLRFDNPIKGESRGINVGLLAANKLVSNEAVAVLYQQRIFNFTTNVHSVVPFLSSLSDQARQNLHGITMELHDKSEPDYCCGFTVRSIGVRDRGVQAAWSKACVYIADNVTVNTLFLTINVKIPAEFRSLTWVEDLVKIKKLKSLMLHANQHLNSGPVLIKASYKEGSVSATDHCDSEHLVPFFEYLREEMLE